MKGRSWSRSGTGFLGTQMKSWQLVRQAIRFLHHLSSSKAKQMQQIQAESSKSYSTSKMLRCQTAGRRWTSELPWLRQVQGLFEGTSWFHVGWKKPEYRWSRKICCIGLLACLVVLVFMRRMDSNWVSQAVCIPSEVPLLKVLMQCNCSILGTCVFLACNKLPSCPPPDFFEGSGCLVATWSQRTTPWDTDSSSPPATLSVSCRLDRSLHWSVW